MLKGTVLILLLFTTLALSAQKDTVVLKVGSELINGEIIKDYTNKWRVTYVNAQGEEVPNKIWTDYGQVIELDGKNYFHRVQDLYDPEMNLVDTWINMVEHKTLAPVSNSTLKPTGSFLHIQFAGDKLTGTTNQVKASEVTEFSADFDQEVFDWNLYGMLLVGLPLKEGFVAKLPFYSLQKNGQDWLSLAVTAKETLPLANGKKVTTWKIETNQNLVFWISKSAPYVIKLESRQADGSKLVWDVF